MIDWFFTADKLKKHGIMILDDIELRPVSMLVDFLKSDPRWTLISVFKGKTAVFRKTVDVVHDVSWHMQPFSVSKLDVFCSLAKAKLKPVLKPILVKLGILKFMI